MYHKGRNFNKTNFNGKIPKFMGTNFEKTLGFSRRTVADIKFRGNLLFKLFKQFNQKHWLNRLSVEH